MIASVGSVIHDVGPWAGAVNTALLIVLASRQHRQGQELTSTHADVNEAASAAAQSAEAAAESCRVAKAIGATMRTEHPPVPR